MKTATVGNKTTKFNIDGGFRLTKTATAYIFNWNIL